MRVLVACEFSGTVRRAFRALGHDAWSCDLLSAEDCSAHHIQDDVRNHLHRPWDLLIAHPPCTRLANSGVCWLSKPPRGKTTEQIWRELDEGAALFSACWNAPIQRVVVENPIMHGHAKTRIINYEPSTQTLAPWQFGDPVQKKVCLWLRGLAPLVVTDPIALPEPGFCIRKTGSRAGKPYRYYFHQGKSAHERSRFFPGIAAAMAEQWAGAATASQAA